MTRLLLLCICVVSLTLNACASRPGMKESFERSVKDYSKLLRWREIDDAGRTYVTPEQRDEYLKQADDLKKRGLSVTDFRILSMRCQPEKRTGDVTAEFDYYLLPSNRVETIADHQEWVYRESSNSWQLTSGLPAFK